MPKIKGILVAVPAPVRIGVGEMAFTGAVCDAAFQAFADLVPVRGGMGMDTGAVTREGDAIRRNEAVPEGREQCSKAEEALEPILIMKGEVMMSQ